MEIEICNTCRTFLSSEHVVSLRATLLLVGEFLAHMFSTSEANLKNSKSNPPPFEFTNISILQKLNLEGIIWAAIFCLFFQSGVILTK